MTPFEKEVAEALDAFERDMIARLGEGLGGDATFGTLLAPRVAAAIMAGIQIPPRLLSMRSVEASLRALRGETG